MNSTMLSFDIVSSKSKLLLQAGSCFPSMPHMSRNILKKESQISKIDEVHEGLTREKIDVIENLTKSKISER